MAERRDIEEVKLTSSDILDVDIKDEDLKDLDLGDELSSDDLLEDDFSDPLPRPRKKRKSLSMTTLVLMLVLVVVGGGFLLLNNETLTRAISSGGSVSGDRSGGEGSGAVVPQETAENTNSVSDPMELSPTPSGEASGPQGFSDLPQPDMAAPSPSAVVSDPVADPVPVPSESVPASPLAVEQPISTPSVMAADPELPPPVAENVVAPEVVPPENTEKKEPSSTVSDAPLPVDPPEVKETVTVAPVKPEAKPDVPQEVQVSTKKVEEQPVKEPPSAQLVTPTPVDPPVPPVAASDVDPASEQYTEEVGTVAKWGKLTEPRLNIPYDQEDRNLGIAVGEPPVVQEPSADSLGVNIESKIAAASRALALERYQAAFDMFDSLYENNKRDERVLMGRAVSLQKLGRNEEAIKTYDALLGLNPASPEVMTNMLGLVRQEYPTQALARLLELRQRYPNNAIVAAQTGLANAGVGNFEEGLRYLGIAAGLEPNNPKHPFNMAIIAERMGKADMAISYYERALKADALSEKSENKINRDLVYDRLSLLRQR